MSLSSEVQIKEKIYKTKISSLFDRAADIYGSDYFNYFAKQLVNFVSLSSKAHVLDVATGRGVIIKHLVENLDLEGKITGIDLSSEMVKRTQTDFKRYPNIKILQMDGENLLFADNSFDAVFCSFGIFFMPDIEKALNEFKRVLKEGGRLALSIWGKRDVTHDIVFGLATQFSLDTKVTAHRFSGPEPVIKILKDVGFKDISTKKEIFVQIYPSFESWWNSLWSHGTRAILEQLSNSKLEEFKSVLREKIKPLLISDALSVNFEAFCILANR